MMKLQDKKTRIDKLIFQWDHKAPRFLKDVNVEHNNSLDGYFDLLSEIRPHKQELKPTKVFGIPFTL